MNNQSKDFTASVVVNKTAREAFHSILNLRGWWSEEIEGSPENLNEVVAYHYKDIHLCTLQLIEKTADKRIVWKVIDNYFNFIRDQKEWTGTHLIFELTEREGETEIDFVHQGLTNADECYNVCSDAWSGYLKNSLKKLIEQGRGNPSPKEGDGFNAELAKKWKLA